jgi:hypothetical protein
MVLVTPMSRRANAFHADGEEDHSGDRDEDE